MARFFLYLAVITILSPIATRSNGIDAEEN